MVPKVSGSAGPTPTRRVATSRVRKPAASRPIKRPMTTSVIPCRITRTTTSSARAPSAIRMPNSWVRWPTAYDITP
ncbi:hypothetical protein D3C83_216570 [compost metagenome]